MRLKRHSKSYKFYIYAKASSEEQRKETEDKATSHSMTQNI